MRTKTIWAGMLTIISLLLVNAIMADVPRVISYQGRLKNTAGVPYNGTLLTKFTIYDNASSAIWNSGFISVTYDSGLCAVKLGESPQPVLPTSNWTSDTGLTLGITVNVDPEILPRTKFTTVGYAMHAKNSESTPWGGITGVPAGFADGTDANTTYTAGSGLTLGGGAFSISPSGVNSGHLADLGVATADVANDAITEPKIATSAVTTSEILDGAIMNSDINAAAAIAATKISGTAAILSGANVFTIANRFNSGVGLSTSSVSSDQMTIQPADFATAAGRWGIYSVLTNSSTGDVIGNRSFASTNTPGISYGHAGVASGGAIAYGVYGTASLATTNWAGYFAGNLHCTGTLSKGGGAFRIDHPLDPENKILQHSFVESPDMMNVYNGNVMTDATGLATVVLPDYFEALNRDFRYQLTVIGQFAQAIIAEEISANQFAIRTDKPNVKVSWQVTGVRHDKFAEANRIQVEVDKLPDQKGLYLHATEYGLPVDKSVDREQIRESEKRRAESTAQNK